MIKFVKIKDVKSPERGTKYSSGIDFFVPSIESIKKDIKFTPLHNTDQQYCKEHFIAKDYIIVPVGMGVMIPSGLKVMLPEGQDGYTFEMAMYNKSGIAVKYNLVVGAQIIDSDYQGEFNLHLINTSRNAYMLKEGQKVVQGIVRAVKLDEISFIDEEEFNQRTTERGDGGFGSTGE